MNILDEIVKRNLPELENRKREKSFSELEEEARRTPGRPGFADAFRAEGIHVIAELKKASPSKGLIRPELDVPRLAKELESAGAAALSVLTEPFYFQGSPGNLKRASETCRLPLLRKDFLFDPYQIAEAKALGASAVLLIAAMLPAERFAELARYARSLDLDVLGEAHSEDELETVQCADLIGINARDLRDFSTSLERSERLIRIARSAGRPVIAESAVRTPDDMKKLRGAGASGFLIGETLMRAPEPGAKLRELLSCF